MRTLINNDLPSGYTYLGIVGYITNNPKVFVSAVINISTNYGIQLYNMNSNSISQNFTFAYLCKHD